MKKALSAVLVSALLFSILAVLIGFLPTSVFAEETTETGFKGKTISILGDSISTYIGVSNDATVNSTLAGGAVYYNGVRHDVYQEDTWWQQTIDQLGMELLVNNSWSGGCILNKSNGVQGAYIDRCVQLHNTAGAEPDIIAVYLGTNDFWFANTLGTAAAIQYDTLITASDDGFCYAEPKTACEAYAIMLHKMKQRYPNAEIYCFTLLPWNNLSASKVQLFQRVITSITQIANRFDAYTVDLYNDCGIKADKNFDFYLADNALHPSHAGMDAITGCFVSTLLQNSQYSSKAVHGISFDLTDVIVDQGTATVVEDGSSFACSFTVPDNHVLDVTVTMGGQDITADCYGNNRIAIPEVSDDLHITASSELVLKDPKSFRWECIDDQLVSVTEFGNSENNLNMTQGSIADGKFGNAVFTLNEPIVLKYDTPWFLEWKSEITDTNNTTGGALMFASASESNTTGKLYLFCPQKGNYIALGVFLAGKHYQYGVSLSAHGINGAMAHTYRLANRIFEDGSNMIYLYVDDKVVGPMNHLWVSMIDKNETVNWLEGQNFIFDHLGTSPHTINNFKIDHIQVSEDGHAHSYTASITAPTCTEQGYTTHTCACGNSYVTDYVDANGHDYRDGTCSDCGKPIPVLTLRSPTLDFRDMIKVVAFFTAENPEDVVEMGMITYKNEVSEWNVDNAEYVIPGAAYDENSGRYYASSQGIHAKQLADDVYLAVYAKLTNGSYVYSQLVSYSAATYAYNQLENSDDVQLKQLVVSMLNYGAQAQRYFSHNMDNLANAGLTEEQRALADTYHPEMVQSVPAVSVEKQSAFLNNQGFASRRPAVSFEEAFCIDYFFTPAYAPVGEITMYYWNEADLNAAEVVTAENASGSLVMVNDGSGQYRADITGIAAKDLSSAVYVAAVYSDGTTTWSSGVLGYSIGAYCGSQAVKGGAVAELAKATAVYGHHAKEYFG